MVLGMESKVFALSLANRAWRRCSARHVGSVKALRLALNALVQFLNKVVKIIIVGSPPPSPRP
jgi:hypothetical protein